MMSATWKLVCSSVRLYRSSQALSVVDKQAYVFGGELVPRQPVDNSVDVVDLAGSGGKAVQTVAAPALAPSPRVGSPSTTVRGNIWIFSGRGGLEMKPVEEEGALWSFDAANGAWSMVKPAESAAPYPLGRSYHCITSDGEGKIFVHAGCPEAGRLSDLWEFDIARRAWRELASAPPPSRGGASIAYVDAKLYRINGFDGKTEQGGSVDVFDIGQGAWSSVQYQPDGKQGPECRSVSVLVPVCIGGKAHLVTAFGERDPSSLGHAGAGKMLSDTWAFSIEEGKWSKVQDAGQEKPEPRGWFDADAMDDDAIIIHGGLNEDNKRLGDVWELRFN